MMNIILICLILSWYCSSFDFYASSSHYTKS